MHTKNYKHSIILDYSGITENGIGCLVSWGGPDRSMTQVIAKDLMTFLEDHYNKLSADFFFSGNGKLESFCRGKPNPSFKNASVATTNGIIVEACAKYIHHFSVFDIDYYGRR